MASDLASAVDIDVVDVRLLDAGGEGGGERDAIVFVEPLYGCVAVAHALDAGWDAVAIDELEPEAAPIPLVSFEQRPTVPGGTCRVRCDELADAPDGALLGCPANARPLASLLARMAVDRIRFVPALASGALAGDAWWASGMLIRVLLEELDGRPSMLTDAAGIAVTLAQGAEAPEQQLVVGERWRVHDARGGHLDDLRVAAAVDSIGAVPRVTRTVSGALARATW